MEQEKIYFWGSEGLFSPKTVFGIQNQYGGAIHRSGILHEVRKNILLGVKKVKISVQSPKTEFEAKISMIVCHVHRSGILHGVRKNIHLGVKKAKISLQSPKTEFGSQNQYDRVTCPSIGNFSWRKKEYTFGGQKGENKASEPKNGTKAPKYQK
jgi:hypothetical protein